MTKFPETFNSIDKGSSQPSLQAKDGGGPKHPNITVKFPPLSLSVIYFTTAAHAFFVRVARHKGLGNRGFLRIRRVPAFIAIFGRGSCILCSLYSNGVRNQRVKDCYEDRNLISFLDKEE
ncbi:hypothetical protein AVEN_117431-1 [Araneus ventricosus]|uniref:Uncharacterized protein n=1 Tax=Araneus ventricosus TaxID=182803 RepID=A0A4Y2I4Y1_ARAVE|nr:hypothetical protein AVEN_117431-1 [Araneus ventricosus]